MTIDEAIQYAENLGTEEENKIDYDKDSPHTIIRRKNTVKDYRQLAEWLKELKDLREQNVELKSTLNAALKDIHGKNICEVMNACKLCAMKFQQLCDIFPWQHANEALKLIGETNDEP